MSSFFKVIGEHDRLFKSDIVKLEIFNATIKIKDTKEILFCSNGKLSHKSKYKATRIMLSNIDLWNVVSNLFDTKKISLRIQEFDRILVSKYVILHKILFNNFGSSLVVYSSTHTVLVYPTKVKVLSEDTFLTQAYVYSVVEGLPVGRKALAVVSKYSEINYGLIIFDDSGNIYVDTKPDNTSYYFTKLLNYSLFFKEHKEFF